MAQNTMLQNPMTQPAEDLTQQPALRLIDTDAPTQMSAARVAERRDNVIVLEFRPNGGGHGTFAPVVSAKRPINWSKLFDAGVVLLTLSSAVAAVSALMTMGQL